MPKRAEKGHLRRFHRQTVKKYMQLEKVPKRQPHPNARYRHSLTKEQTLYLTKRWQEGNTKPRQIWRELKQQGYKGVASCIYRAIVFSRFKAELLEGGAFLSVEDARTEIFDFI